MSVDPTHEPSESATSATNPLERAGITAFHLRLERMIAYFDQNSSGTIGEAEFVQDPMLQVSLVFQTFFASTESSSHDQKFRGLR